MIPTQWKNVEHNFNNLIIAYFITKFLSFVLRFFLSLIPPNKIPGSAPAWRIQKSDLSKSDMEMPPKRKCNGAAQTPPFSILSEHLV